MAAHRCVQPIGHMPSWHTAWNSVLLLHRASLSLKLISVATIRKITTDNTVSVQDYQAEYDTGGNVILIVTFKEACRSPHWR